MNNTTTEGNTMDIRTAWATIAEMRAIVAHRSWTNAEYARLAQARIVVARGAER